MGQIGKSPSKLYKLAIWWRNRHRLPVGLSNIKFPNKGTTFLDPSPDKLVDSISPSQISLENNCVVWRKGRQEQHNCERDRQWTTASVLFSYSIRWKTKMKKFHSKLMLVSTSLTFADTFLHVIPMYTDVLYHDHTLHWRTWTHHHIYVDVYEHVNTFARHVII